MKNTYYFAQCHMEFVESHGIIGGVFKEAILEKSFSKSKPFKDFQSSLPTNVQFWQFCNLFFSRWENFWQSVAYCAINIHSYKVLVCRDSDQNYKLSCDNTIAVAIDLQKVAIHIHVWEPTFFLFSVTILCKPVIYGCSS